MVNSDSPLLLRPFFPIYHSCISSHDPSIVFCFPSSNPIAFIATLGITRQVVFLSSWIGSGPQGHRGLVCNAVHRMTPRGPLTRVHETCDWMLQAGFWKTIRSLDCEGDQLTLHSGISSIGSSIISYSKGIPLADFASTTDHSPSYCC